MPVEIPMGGILPAFVLTTPGMLYSGMVIACVPIFIHLLHRRRKPIYWASMMFLIEAWKATRRRRRLEKIILLCVRCSIPVLLGLILSQPITSGIQPFTSRTQTLHIIIDDGVISSTRTKTGTPELSELLAKATELTNSLEPGDLIQVVRSSSLRKPGSPTTNTDGALQQIRGISGTQLPSRIQEAFEYTSEAIRKAERDTEHRVILLSTFRKGAFAHKSAIEANWPKGVVLNYSKPATNQVNNTKIKAVKTERGSETSGVSATKSGTQSISIKLERVGTELPALDTTIEIKTNPITISRRVHWNPGQQHHDSWFKIPLSNTLPTEVLVKLGSQDALEADDTAYAVTAPRQTPKSLFISRNSAHQGPKVLSADHWIRLALYPTSESTPPTSTVDPTTLQPTDLSGIDLVVLTRPDLMDPTTATLLKEHVQSGGVLLITPPEEKGKSAWGGNIFSTLDVPWATTASVQEHEPPIGVSLTESTPGKLPLIQNEISRLLEPIHIRKTHTITGAREGETILKLPDETPAILISAPPNAGAGQIIFFSFSPTPRWSNLPTQPLMVPLIQELIHGLLSRSRSGPQLFTGQHLEINNPTPGTTLVLDEYHRLPIDTETSRTIGVVDQPGVWRLQRTGRSGVQPVVVNINPSTSMTTPTPSKEVSRRLGSGWEEWSPNEQEKQFAEQGSLQEYLLLLLLLLITLDAVLANRFTPSRSTMVRAPIP